MNEQIRELAEKAGYSALPGFDFANSLEELFIERFAQLIIEECVTAVNSADDSGEDFWGTVILQHFGVDCG